MPSHLIVEGAYEHNLKHISLKLPKNQLIVVTGPSGSGKSSLVQDTLAKESQRLFFEGLSMYSRSYFRIQEPAKVKRLAFLSPVISIDQKSRVASNRSTVGTVSEIVDYLRLMFARFGTLSHQAHSRMSMDSLAAFLVKLERTQKIWFCYLAVENKKGSFGDLFQKWMRKGIVYAFIDGKLTQLTEGFALDRHQKHSIEPVFDTFHTKFSLGKQKLSQITSYLKSVEASSLVVRSEHHRWDFAVEGMSDTLQPYHFSFNTPYGKCQTCDGLGEDAEGEPCLTCLGCRVRAPYSSVQYNHIRFQQASLFTLKDMFQAFSPLQTTHPIEQAMLDQLVGKLRVLHALGLGYLSVSRSANTLSGGETQRLRIGSQVSQAASGMLYLFDEPSIGLHPSNTHTLLEQLSALSKRNTVIVVEHDLDTIRSADYLVELGPGGGGHGGQVVFSGPFKQFVSKRHIRDSKTHLFIKGPPKANLNFVLPSPSSESRWEVFENIAFRNLSISRLTLPLKRLVGLAGMSGSGKSSLLFDVVLPELKLRGHPTYWVTQDPIGKSSRSAVVTFLEIYQHIRSCFASSASARIRALKPRDFSFNSSPLRCSQCQGTGMERFELHFLPRAEIQCQLCRGQRFESFLLKVQYAEKTISQVLDMSLEEAAVFFHAYPKIAGPLNLCHEVGLGYLKLGQSTSTLSGGEAQRLKLIYELSKRKAKGNIYCLDEPTTGLSSFDIRFLLKLFLKLIVHGNSLVIIEHQTDVLSHCDYLIELGPGGGPEGGKLIACGPPLEVVKTPGSVIAPFLTVSRGASDPAD
jgi:excinuclease ABC subunit A